MQSTWNTGRCSVDVVLGRVRRWGRVRGLEGRNRDEACGGVVDGVQPNLVWSSTGWRGNSVNVDIVMRRGEYRSNIVVEMVQRRRNQ
jgi:hypothetical protein